MPKQTDIFFADYTEVTKKAALVLYFYRVIGMSKDNKSDYFNMSKAVDEYRHESIGGVEKTGAALKVLGKGLFNVATFAVKEVLPAVAEQASKTTIKAGEKCLKNKDIDEDKRAEIEARIEKAKEFIDKKKEERSKKEQAEQAEQAEQFYIIESQETINTTHVDNHLDDKKEIKIQVSLLEDELGNISKKDLEPSLVDLLSEFKVSDKDKKRVFIYPDIPKDKLKNAIGARHERLYNEQALILIDDTMFCSAKDGILVTDETLSLKKAFTQSNDYITKHGCSLDELSSFRLSNVSNIYVDLICAVLRKYFEVKIDWHKKKASVGVVHSQFFLSCVTPLILGNEERLYWLINSAKNGHPSAQHNLGMLLMHIDEMESCYWFELAAEKGIEHSKQRLKDIGSRRVNTMELESPGERLRSIICKDRLVVKNESDVALTNAIKRVINDEG